MAVSIETNPLNIPSEAWIKPAIAGKHWPFAERERDGDEVNYAGQLLGVFQTVGMSMVCNIHFRDLHRV